MDQEIKKEQQHKMEFKETIWNVILKENENDFKEAFSGFRGNKEKFCEEVISRYKQSHSSSETKESLQKRSKTLFSNKLEKYNTIDIDVNNSIAKLEAIEKDPIWQKIVVGNKDVPIAKLINHFDNSDWVNKGRAYITESGVCPFCQQKTITTKLQQELETFFSGEYKKDIQYIHDLIESYNVTSNQIILDLGNAIKLDFVSSIGNMDISKYNTLIESLKLIFENTLTEMSSKEKETNKRITISTS